MKLRELLDGLPPNKPLEIKISKGFVFKYCYKDNIKDESIINKEVESFEDCGDKIKIYVRR